MTLYIGDRVVMVDRYRERFKCACKAPHESSFIGLRGKVTRVKPTIMVHLDGERLPMVFDARDFVRDEPSEASMTGAE